MTVRSIASAKALNCTRRRSIPNVVSQVHQKDNPGFDLGVPQMSPLAQAATYDADRFLALTV
jgi:hypothetical protein